jgi:formylglycine-generating enzyme required for sulfatase activity
MGGNVSEWTATWDEDALSPGTQVPVYRGSNWRTGSNDPSDTATATRRGTKLTEIQSDTSLGFRTASDTPQ